MKAEAQKLAAAGHKAIALRCDDVQVEQMVSRTVSEFGRLDAVFNNASVMARIAPTGDGSREDCRGSHLSRSESQTLPRRLLTCHI